MVAWPGVVESGLAKRAVATAGDCTTVAAQSVALGLCRQRDGTWGIDNSGHTRRQQQHGQAWPVEHPPRA